MPVKLAWYDAPHVIVVFWSGAVTTEDVEHYVHKLREMLLDSRAPVFIMNDLGEVTQPFMNMGVIRAYLRDTMTDPRIEWLLGYHIKTPIISFLAKFVARLYSLNVQTFDSWEDAQAFLESLDTGLDFSRTPAPPNTAG